MHVYKTAPGEYKEWAMSALNRAVAEMEGEYPELKQINHNIKDWWLKKLVWILTTAAQEADEEPSSEHLESIKEKGEEYIKEAIQKYFSGERMLDEMLWEEQMKNSDK